MNKIKILRVVTRLNIGGPAIQAILLTSGLDTAKFESLLACGQTSEFEENMLYLAKKKQVNPFVISELGRKISFCDDLSALWKLYFLMRKFKPDIVHTHMAKAGCLGRIGAIMAGVPIRIHTFHGHVFHGYFSGIVSRIFILLERFLAFFSSKIIAVGGLVKKDLIKYRIAQESKIQTIPLGLELGSLLMLSPPVDSGILRIGIVGRLTGVKNHKLFLNVAKEILEKYTNLKKVEFLIVGDGELKPVLLGLVKELGIESQVCFAGWIKDMSEIYSELDIICLTSLNEGTPVSLLEAMAAARPVVATNVGGIKDIVLEESSTFVRNHGKIIISDRGIVVDSFDPKVFADALLLLINDANLRKNLGRAGREFVRGRFNKNRLIADMESLYERLIQEKGLRL